MSEPAILLKRINSGSQIWSMEKLENKLIDMREMYQEYNERVMAGLVSIRSCIVVFISLDCYKIIFY